MTLSYTPKKHGLTLIETLASLALLSMVTGACVSWIVLASRGSHHVLDLRRTQTRLDRIGLFIDEHMLRAGPSAQITIDEHHAMIVPTRWWVAGDTHRRFDLAESVRIEHDPDAHTLVMTFANVLRQPLGETRVLMAGISQWSIESIQGPELNVVHTATATTLDGLEWRYEWASPGEVQ